MLQMTMTKLDREKSSDVDNELSEACMNTLQAIIRKCPREVAQFIPGLFSNALELLEYDPNYTYNDDEHMAEDNENEDWGSDFAEDEQEAMQDDDDSSWKVRRSAIKIIEAIILTRPEFIKTIVQNYQNRLVDRFKERIDDVKIDLLDAFRELLIASVEAGPSMTVEMQLRNQPSISKTKSYNSQILESSTPIVKALIKQVQSKHLKVRISSFACLSELSRTLQFGMDQHINDLFPLLESTLTETQSFEPLLYSLKILHRLFRSYKAGTKCNFLDLSPQITGFLVRGLGHEYSKVISDSLHATSSFINALKDAQNHTIQD